MEFLTRFKNYHASGYSSLFILTHEEQRVTKDIISLTEENKETTIFEWDAQNGLVKTRDRENMGDGLQNSTELLRYIQHVKTQGNIFILKDFHLHFDKVINIRLLRNAWNLMKSRGNIIVFVGHKFAIPPELEKEIQLIDYDLPDAGSIQERLQYIVDSVNKLRAEKDKKPLVVDPHIINGAVEAAKGMTYGEIENAFAMAYTTNKTFNQGFVSTVFDEKIAQLKKNGLLTYIPADVSFDNVGGLSGLKRWLRSRKKGYSQEAIDYNLPLPKGCMFCSVPGVGKTMLAKATAHEFDCPLFLFDLGNLFGSHVGDSERNMREAIKIIESIGKCVILIDEIEKAMSKDAVSGRGDTGVSSRIYGTFLTWLNDRKNPAFIIATSNDHTILPSPLIRKGRFDQLFWVDLPSQEEREEIFNVVIRKYGRNPEDFLVSRFVDAAEEFTGAEIEEVIKSALFRAFDNGLEISDKDIMQEITDFIPFAKSHEEELHQMRLQARGKLVVLSEQGETQTIDNALRKLSIELN
jgi:ATP-dependent 26S proteasome regulatory subunit